jgi:hypothetical protein
MEFGSQVFYPPAGNLDSFDLILLLAILKVSIFYPPAGNLEISIFF